MAHAINQTILPAMETRRNAIIDAVKAKKYAFTKIPQQEEIARLIEVTNPTGTIFSLN